MNIVPARDFCFVDNDIWFVTRGANLLLRHSLIDKKTYFIGCPGEKSISNTLEYSYTCYWEKNVVCIPIFADSYSIYSLSNQTFTNVKTESTKREISFGNIAQYCSKVFCIPVYSKDSIAVFNMETMQEEAIISIPNKIEGECFPLSCINNTKIGWLIYPTNRICILDMETRTFDFLEFDYGGELIDSIYLDEKCVYVHEHNTGIISVYDYNGKKNTSLDIKFKERVEFIGKWENGIFVDAVDKPCKYIIKKNRDEYHLDVFDENLFSNSCNRKNAYGIIKQNDRREDIYLSGYSCGCFLRTSNEILFSEFSLGESETKKIKKYVINEEMRDSLHFESYAFSLKDYVDIVRWR